MVTRYQFPIHDRDRYQAKVSFHAFEVIPPSITFGNNPGIDANAIGADDASDESSVSDQVKDLYNSVVEAANIGFTGDPETRYLDKCTLFLPQSVTFQDGVGFDDFDLGRIGAGAEQGINNGKSAVGILTQGPAQAVSALTDLFDRAPSSDIARLAATRIARAGGSAVQGGVQSALRVTANPNKRILFREVRIREFSFSFKLSPTSKEEAEEIKRIIKFFRSNLYPEDFGVGEGENRIPIGYKYPNQFNIVMKHKGNEIAHRILPSYLVVMQTVYNPTGMGFFEDGNFTETEINLTFRESRTLNKKDILEGNY